MWLRGGTYETWAAFLERWATGDDDGVHALPQIRPGDFNAETMARFTNRITGAMSKRLQAWADLLTRAIATHPDEFSVGRTLSQARVGLRGVRALAVHPGLPQELRTQLTRMLDEQIGSVQDQLEQDVDRMARQGAGERAVEARRRTIRDNALTAVVAEAPGTYDRSAGWSVDPGAKSRRQIVVD